MGLFDFFKKKKVDSLGNPINGDEIRNIDWGVNSEEELQNIDPENSSFKITVEDVFSITGRGTIVTGQIEAGTINLGDKVIIVRSNGVRLQTVVAGVEMFRKILSKATVGDDVGLLLKGVDKDMVSSGDIIIKP